MQLKDYSLNLIDSIPQTIYNGTASVFCVGLIGLIAWKGFKMGFRYGSVLLLIEYVFLVFCSTVIYRKVCEGAGHNFIPFWSYGKPELVVENIMNVVVFVPVGILLGSLLRGKGSWLIALAVGMGISLSIETMQYVFHRGFAEVDDVMHNTVGCILGYMIVQGEKLIVKGYNKIHG